MTAVDGKRINGSPRSGDTGRRLVYISPEFPKSRHGFEANELVALRAVHEVTVVSLRKPGATGWQWLRRGFPDLANTQIVCLTPTTTVVAALAAMVRSPKAAAVLALEVALTVPRDLRGAMKFAIAGLGGLAAARIARRMGADWIHADFASAPATAGMIASAATGLPFSFCGHAFDVFSQKPAGRATEYLLGRKLRAARVAFGANSAARDVLVRLGRRAAVATPVVLKRNGVPATSCVTDGARDRDKGTPFTVVGLGALVHKKGFDTLVESCAALQAAIPSLRLEIHGEGPERTRLEALAKERAISVSLPGAYTYDSLPSIFERASVVVLASRRSASNDSDGVPTVFIEALAAGCPVIGTDVGSITDLIIDGVTGWVVPPEATDALASAIAEVYAQPEVVAARVRAGQALVRREFTSEASAQDFTHALELGAQRSMDP